jgi:hypothetical protein
LRLRVLILTRGSLPSEREGAALSQLRDDGFRGRIVRVRTGQEEVLVPCELAYSFHSDLVTPYGDRGNLLGGVPDKAAKKPEQASTEWDITIPTGYLLEKAGPYFRLYDTSGDLVGGKALHRGKMQQLTEDLNGSLE